MLTKDQASTIRLLVAQGIRSALAHGTMAAFNEFGQDHEDLGQAVFEGAIDGFAAWTAQVKDDTDTEAVVKSVADRFRVSLMVQLETGPVGTS